MIVFTVLAVGLIVFEIAQIVMVSPEVNPTITVFYWLLPISILMAIFMIFLMGYAVQYVIVSEEGLKARCLWFTIRTLKWDEVKEVRCERFYVSVEGGFTSGWFVFDDGVERKQIGNGSVLRKKANYITLTASKRARKTIETYWNGPIVENQIK